MDEKAYAIRLAKREDAAEISDLSGELGYSVSTPQMQERFRGLLDSGEHAVYVAVLSGGNVVGCGPTGTPLTY